MLKLAKSLVITLLLSHDSAFLSCAFGMREAAKRKWQNVYLPVITESTLTTLLPLDIPKCFPVDLEYKLFCVLLIIWVSLVYKTRGKNFHK